MNDTVAIVDYGSGNLHSAPKAFERAARDCGRDLEILVTADPDRVAKAGRVVLPGVGAFADCRRGLDAVPGMIEALYHAAIMRGRPFLGICVGMQLMGTRGLERGEETRGLAWIEGDVVALKPSDPALKIPHMGWNELKPQSGGHALLDGLEPAPNVYFVHSYHLQAKRAAEVKAIADHGGAVTALVARDNLAGVQFHPEKSQTTGLRLIANFLGWTP